VVTGLTAGLAGPALPQLPVSLREDHLLPVGAVLPDVLPHQVEQSPGAQDTTPPADIAERQPRLKRDAEALDRRLPRIRCCHIANRTPNSLRDNTSQRYCCHMTPVVDQVTKHIGCPKPGDCPGFDIEIDPADTDAAMATFNEALYAHVDEHEKATGTHIRRQIARKRGNGFYRPKYGPAEDGSQTLCGEPATYGDMSYGETRHPAGIKYVTCVACKTIRAASRER
jgi:hypothetical protein